MDEKRIDIVIIGAGIAGLACARELSKNSNNVNLLVLEASDRIGGRIKSVQMNDGTVLELGAHYIHGTVGNPIYDLAVEKGIILPDRDKEWKSFKILRCFHKDVLSVCTELKLNEAVNIGVEYNSVIMEELNNADVAVNEYASIGDYVMSKFKQKLEEYPHDSEFCMALKSVFISMMNEECYTNGCVSLYDLDFKGYISYVDLDGDLEYILHENGYSQIVNAIAGDIKVDCIKLNHEVDKIENVETDGEAKLRIHCSNEKIFYADSVVLTVSVEVLKTFLERDQILPALPKQKKNAIDKLHLEKIAKIYFKFLVPIDKDTSFIQFCPSADNFNFIIFEKYNQILSIDRVKDSDWWLLWLLGDLITELENNGPMKFLKYLFTELRALYPTFPKSDIDVDNVVVSDWTTNPFYKGSYSYLKLGSNCEDINKLSEAVNFTTSHLPTNLLFAGDMTNVECYSTTHGAFLSGIREANRIKSIYKLS